MTCLKDPQPFEPSDKVINKKFARRGSIACQAELITQRSIGHEDCLHISVYTHDINPRTLKPVMVWVHGGAFIFGSNSKEFYDPEFLMRSNIVLFAMNYRLGTFGEFYKIIIGVEYIFKLETFFTQKQDLQHLKTQKWVFQEM